MSNWTTTRPRKKATPESLVLKDVLQYLNLCRIGKVIRNNVGQIQVPDSRGGKGRFIRFGVPGQADVTVEITDSPLCVHVECKAPGGKLSDHQAAWLDAQRKRGHVCIVAKSAMDVYEALAAAGFEVPAPGGRRKKEAA